MATTDNNEFLARGATGGSYDIPNYGAIGAITRAVLPTPKRPRGAGGRRTTMEMLEQGQEAAAKAAVDTDTEALKGSLEEVIPQGERKPPLEQAQESAKQTPAPKADDGTGQPGDLDPVGATLNQHAVKGPGVEDIEAVRGTELERRTRERNINLDYVESPEDVGAVLEAGAARLGYGEEAPYSLEQLREDVDGKQMEIFKQVLEDNPQALSQQQMLAGRDILMTLSQRQDELARKVANNQATPEEVLEFDKVTDTAATVLNYMQGKIRETARTLNSMKAVTQTVNSMDATRIHQEVQSGNAMERARALIEAKAAGVPADERIKLGEEMSKLKKAGTALINLRSAGLVSGFKTQAVNMISNTFWGGLRTLAVKPIAAAVGRIRTGGGGDRVYLAEAAAEVTGTIHAFRDALNVAYSTWYHGTTTNQGEYISPFGGRKVDEATDQVGHIGSTMTEFVESTGKPGEVVGKAIRAVRADKAMDWYQQDVEAISFGLLTASDDFFKTMHYRKSLYSQATRKVMEEGLEGKEATERVNELLNDVTGEMHNRALKEAEIQTFTNREDVTDLLAMLSNGAVKLGNTWPVFRWWAPFIRTPVSLVDRTFKMTPFRMMSNEYKQRISQGGPDADMARAEIIFGTSFAGMMTMLIGMGLITGNGPSRSQDPQGNYRKTLEASGWQPNSILIDGKYISLERGFDPVMLPVIGIAQVIDSARFSKTEPEFAELALGAALAASEQFVSNTFMTGIKELMDLVTGQVNYNEYIGRQAGSMVPSLLRDIKSVWRYARGEEGREYAPRTGDLGLAIQYSIAARTPGMESPMVARYWDGSVATPGGGDAMFMWNTMMPIRSSWAYNTKGRQADPATEALIVNGVGPSQPKPDIVLDPESGYTINLLTDLGEDGTQLYGLMLEIVGETRRQYVEHELKGSDYQGLEEKGLLGPNSWAAILMDKAIRRGLKDGKQKFMEKINNPSFSFQDYGIVDPQSVDVLTGENYKNMVKMYKLQALSDEERKSLQEGGFRGLPTRETLSVPKGDYIPQMPD